ncbi:phosphate ABC transporter permease subunit PstC [Parvibaculum sedimenti]|uniref:Phosphate transport system permease protein n=2 Tax=Parvibaculum sedimenti TaxID=2608632 RepID=A0A6N6VFU7_9HYPH|nr:phosphate ABC transporter permease subunit PstC [Parvibaculum sedimenti]
MLEIATLDREKSMQSRRSRFGMRLGDPVFRGVTFAFTVFVLLILGGVIAVLFDGAWPALHKFGPAFVWASGWNPVTEKFGALVPLVGTIITSIIAMVIGVPFSFGLAFFLTEICPHKIRQPIAIAIELLAAVPSIIYGIWGLFVLAPLFQHYVEPFLISTLGSVPVLGMFFQGPPIGIGMLLAGLILGLMVLPFITAVMREVFLSVPPVLRESAYGLGATRWEVVWRVVLPYCRTGVVGGVMLGLGRALGETMAVTFVIGNAHRLSASLLAPGTTISAALANEFTEADGEIYTASLIGLGLVLFVLTFFVLAIGKRLLLRSTKGTLA